jgi:putative redox protein
MAHATMTSQITPVQFPGAAGPVLSGRLHLPSGIPRACVLFAHCFTCGKDVLAAARIARRLSALGLAVLRFDFTGLGDSEGDFTHTDFSSNVQDLVAAAAFLRQNHEAPALLVGHSLGGAAVLVAASAIPECRAVATIAAPSDPAHVSGLFGEHIAQIVSEGEARVRLAGRSFRIRREFLDDIAEQNLARHIAALARPLLVMHSPADAVVPLADAGAIFAAAQHPKSFIALDGADHLLSSKGDADRAARLIAAWSARYLTREA